MKQLVQNNSCITWMILLFSQIEIDILSFLKCILVMIKSFSVRYSNLRNLRGTYKRPVGHRIDSPYRTSVYHPDLLLIEFYSHRLGSFLDLEGTIPLSNTAISHPS